MAVKNMLTDFNGFSIDDLIMPIAEYWTTTGGDKDPSKSHHRLIRGVIEDGIRRVWIAHVYYTVHHEWHWIVATTENLRYQAEGNARTKEEAFLEADWILRRAGWKLMKERHNCLK